MSTFWRVFCISIWYFLGNIAWLDWCISSAIEKSATSLVCFRQNRAPTRKDTSQTESFLVPKDGDLHCFLYTAFNSNSVGKLVVPSNLDKLVISNENRGRVILTDAIEVCASRICNSGEKRPHCLNNSARLGASSGSSDGFDTSCLNWIGPRSLMHLLNL